MLCTAIIGAVIGGVIGGASYALQQASTGQRIDPYKLVGNVLFGAAEGAAIGVFLPGAGFLTGALMGAGSGFLSDAVSQIANGG